MKEQNIVYMPSWTLLRDLQMHPATKQWGASARDSREGPQSDNRDIFFLFQTIRLYATVFVFAAHVHMMTAENNAATCSLGLFMLGGDSTLLSHIFLIQRSMSPRKVSGMRGARESAAPSTPENRLNVLT